MYRQYHNPIKAIFTTDYLAVLKSLNLQGNTLLITAPFASQTGLSGKIIDALPSSQVTIYDNDITNPDLDFLDSLHQKFYTYNFSNIVAIGGGSIIDTAKVLSLTLPLKRRNILSSHFRDKETLQFNTSINLIALPTTAGTGSECTPFATVWDKKHSYKYSLESIHILPKLAVLDASLTVSLPYEQTLFTGLDALSHSVESLWNKNLNPISKMYALQAIKNISEAFISLLDELDNISYREKMQFAGFCAGMAISQTKTAISHAISYPLSYRYNVPHGLACSFTIPAIYNSVAMASIKDKDIIKAISKAVAIIEQLPLRKQLESYLTLPELLNLADEMNNPTRFNNFIAPVDSTTLYSIIKNSYN